MNAPFLFTFAAAAVSTVPADVPGSFALRLAALLGLIFLNAFFVAAEFSFVKVRSGQLEDLSENGDTRAKAAAALLDRLDACLSTAQLGITVSTLGLGWLGSPFLAAFLVPCFAWLGIPTGLPCDAVAFFLAFGVLTYLHIVLGELVPKSLAIRHALTVALFVSRPLYAIHSMLRPFVWFLAGSAEWILRRLCKTEPASEMDLTPTDEELRVMLEDDDETEEEDSVGREILRNALDLKNRVACDIMTPRGEVVYLDLQERFEDQINSAIASRHTRFPLCRGHIDEAVGLVHIKDMLALFRDGSRDLQSVMRELHHVSEMMPLEKLLRFFLSKRAHLAVVVDEYGGALGIVTLDNVIEEIVGSIHDEFDAGDESEVRSLGADEWEVDGGMALHEVGELLDTELDSAEVSTIGGYLTSELGHIPQQGETLELGPFLATVTASNSRRVLRVHLRRVKLGSTDPDSEEE